MQTTSVLDTLPLFPSFKTDILHIITKRNPQVTVYNQAAMAQFAVSLALLCCLAAAFFMPQLVFSQAPLGTAEQEAVYRILESASSGIDWRSLFPDDLCSSAPHGVVCDYFYGEAHVTELSFGYVSDYSPNPPCDSNSTFNPSILESLKHLKKLFFYKCFTQKETPFPDFPPSSSMEELVFIENPSMVGSMDGKIASLTSLRRLVLTGSGVSGGLSSVFHELVNLEQLTLSRNKFEGEIPMTAFQNLKKLRVLDLGDNGFTGYVPESIGTLTELLKLDLSSNGFTGRIPEFLKGLNSLEFLDLSYNHFGKFGIPTFLSAMPSLRQVHLSGNYLGGQIPEIWDNLGGIKGLGLSELGLVGEVRMSMGATLRNLCYLSLDNNMLEGIVPEEFGNLESLNELNLQNNRLSGSLPFSPDFLSRLGGKLKVEGNLDLCIGENLKSARLSGDIGKLKVCGQQDFSQTALLYENSSSSSPASMAFGSSRLCVAFLLGVQMILFFLFWS